MRRLVPIFLLFWLVSSPAHGTSHWHGCLAEPTYRCLIDLAAAEAKQIPGRVPRAYATAHVAGAQAVGGLADEARGSAEDALLFGSIIFDAADYGLLISQIVWARAWAGDLDLAGDMLGWTSDPYALALGYAALAEAQVHHGYPENAQRSMRWAMEEVENVRENRGMLLPYLAISHGYVGDAEGVHRLIAEARKITDSDGTPYGRTLAVAAGAVAEAMIGHTEESDALLIEAEDRLKAIEDETDIGVMASHMAWALAEAGRCRGRQGRDQPTRAAGPGAADLPAPRADLQLCRPGIVAGTVTGKGSCGRCRGNSRNRLVLEPLLPILGGNNVYLTPVSQSASSAFDRITP